jgi:hypothetical protein
VMPTPVLTTRRPAAGGRASWGPAAVFTGSPSRTGSRRTGACSHSKPAYAPGSRAGTSQISGAGP